MLSINCLTTNYFNLGTQDGNSVKEVFDVCKKVTNKDIPVDIMERREGDPAKLVADNSKARNLLKWIPEKNLETSIQTAYEWEKTFQSKLSNV